jgi:hypothetical protein
MMVINLQNIETILFKNPEVKMILSDLRYIFDQWLLSYRSPALTRMRKQALIDLLNTLDGIHIEKLAKLFKSVVFIEKVQHNLVKNLELPIMDTAESVLADCNGYKNISISRNADKLSITLVR